ncbi:MAG: hypothetical protein AAFU79_10665 [Myxococcota bacterium]
MLTKQAMSIEDPAKVDGLVHPQPSPVHPLRLGDRVAVGVEAEIALDVDAALVGVVDFRSVV